MLSSMAHVMAATPFEKAISMFSSRGLITWRVIAPRVEDSVPVGVQEVLRGHAVRGSSINGDDQRLGDYWWLWAERGRWEAERPGRRLGRQEGACSPLSNSPQGLTCRFRKHSHF